MDDLISRSALLRRVPVNRKDTGKTAWDWGILYMADIIKTIPAVDAVEVVRCKDCKHSRELNECEKNYLVEEVLICTHPECSDDCWFATWPDHWCSYGERRADHAD